MSVYSVTTNLLCLWSFNWCCLHCIPPRGPGSTTSFGGGGGGGGSYKTTAFIHGAGVKGQAIVLDPQERRTVADCGHDA